MADQAASKAPESVSQDLADTSLLAAGQLLAPSKLTRQRQMALHDYFQSYAPMPAVLFRDAQALGANALTLSQTTIVFTDQLVALAVDDEELLAVYLHEVGHARARHVERTLFQGAAWAVLLTLITGDAAGASELLVALPLTLSQAAYSREFERQADAYAIQALRAAGVQVTKLAAVLQRIERSRLAMSLDAEAAQRPDDQELKDQELDDASTVLTLLKALSSHPLTEERVAHINAAAAQ